MGTFAWHRISPAPNRRFGGSLQILACDDFFLAGIGVDAAGDDAVGDVFEVLLEDLAQFHEFRPEGVIDEAFRHADHDGIAPLAGVTVGAQVVTAQQGHEELLRPAIDEGEFVFERLFDLRGGFEPLLNAAHGIGGGLLNVEVQFNNAGAPVNGTTHDFLNITGNVSGVSTLNILAVAPSTAPTVTSGNGIELVRVGGTTGAGAFVLGGPVVQGGIQYLLNYLPNYSGTLDGYFLQATARDELAGHVAMLSAGRAMLTRCSRGDERFGGAVGASGKRAWAKFMGGSIETGADTGLDTDQEFSCSAGGMDLASGANLRIGLAGAFGDTSVDVTTAAGVSKLEGEQNMIEAQASYDMDGTFVNMTAGYAGTDWTHTGPASGIKTASVDGLVASLQVGRRWSLGEAWQVGVSGGLDYDGTTCADACLLAGVASQESNWRGSLAAKLSGTGAVFRPFAAISYADDLDGGNSVSLGGVSVAADTASSLLGARAGFDARLGERFGLFVDAGMVEGLDNDVTGYDGQAGLRINW